MKKVKMLFILLFSMFIIPIGVVNAETDDYFYADRNVKIEGTTDHNLYVASEYLDDSGTTNGILFAAAKDFKSKSVMDYGAIAAKDVVISSEVKNDLFLVANDIKIDDAVIARDTYIAGNSVQIKKSDLGNNVFIAAATIKLENVTVDGSINLAVDNLEIGDGVIIKGDLIYNETASVQGLDKVDCKVQTYKNKSEIAKANKKVDRKTQIIISIGSLLLIAILVSAIYPKSYQKINEDMSFGGLFKYFGLGILLLIAIPIISCLLMITVIGLPLGVIMLIVYLLAIYISQLWAAMSVGKFLRIKNSVIGTIIGVFVVKGLTYIPYAGDFFLLFEMLLGLGLMLKVMSPTKKEKEDREKNKNNNNNNVSNEEVVEAKKVKEVKEVVEVKETPKEEVEEEVVEESLVPAVVEEKPKRKKAATTKKATTKKTTTKKKATKKDE